jgi:hypothetical protein
MNVLIALEVRRVEAGKSSKRCRLRDTVPGPTCRPKTVTEKPFLRSRFRLAAPRARSERCPKTRSEVFQAVRGMLGLSVQELWLDYVGLGGSLPPLRSEHS